VTTKNYAQAASLYFGENTFAGESLAQKLLRWTTRHLELAGFSLASRRHRRCPLGIVASRGWCRSDIQVLPDRHRANHSVLVPSGVAVPVPFFRNQRAHCHRALFLYGSCRLCATLPLVCRTLAQTLLRIRDRLGLEPGRAALRKSICRSPREPFSPELKRARSFNVGYQPRSPRSLALAD